MKKYLLLTIVACLLQITCSISQEKVKGGFKKCEVSAYSYKFGNVVNESKYLSQLINYDNNGNVIDITDYYTDVHDKVSGKTTYTYNDKGILIEYIEDTNWKTNKYICKYDDKGNKIAEINYNADGSVNWKNVYNYNDKGKKDIVVVYSSDGKIFRQFNYKYDENGNIIEYKKVTLYKGYNEIKYTCKYDMEGNITEKIEYDKMNEPFIKYEYIYSK